MECDVCGRDLTDKMRLECTICNATLCYSSKFECSQKHKCEGMEKKTYHDSAASKGNVVWR